MSTIPHHEPAEPLVPEPPVLSPVDDEAEPAATQEDAITCMYNSLILLRIALKNAIRTRLRGSAE